MSPQLHVTLESHAFVRVAWSQHRAGVHSGREYVAQLLDGAMRFRGVGVSVYGGECGEPEKTCKGSHRDGPECPRHSAIRNLVPHDTSVVGGAFWLNWEPERTLVWSVLCLCGSVSTQLGLKLLV